MKYLLPAIVVCLVTYGQLIIKHAVNRLGPLPAHGVLAIGGYFFRALTDIWVLSGFTAAFLAALAWLATLSKFELSSVYPLLAINFVVVPLLSVLLFHETINAYKICGTLAIVSGILLLSKGI
jgi:drug/metabolite transporter (DMT)-like permease